MMGFFSREKGLFTLGEERECCSVIIQSMVDMDQGELQRVQSNWNVVGYVGERGNWSTVPGLVVSHCERRNTTACLGFPVECAQHVSSQIGK